MRIGAMLAVLAVLAGAFAALPYWTASATDKTIWGLVDECNVPGPSFLGNVLVSLVDAHGVRATQSTSTTSDGHFTFTPQTGSYILKFSLAEHYDNETQVPVRFDGSQDVNVDACLTRMPARTTTLTVLVVDQVSTAWTPEALSFARLQRTENIACGVDPVTGFATLTYHPVVRPLYSFSWFARGLIENTDYTWRDLFVGNLTITDGAILTSLQSTGCLGKFLNATYQYSATSTRLSHYPVVPGSFTVFKNSNPWPASADWSLNLDTGVFTINRNFIFGVDSVSVSYSSTGAVADAQVALYNGTAKQEVARGTTNSTGQVTLAIWGAVLSLQVSKDQYQQYEAAINTGIVNTTRVVVPNGILVYGHARRLGSGTVINTNVVGYLYNKDFTVSRFRKLISANVSGSLYIFYAEPNQPYKMVIDADGYRAAEIDVNSPPAGSTQRDVFLTPSPKEEYRTTVVYPSSDWNNITIWRNLTLLPDTTLSGLDFSGIRSLGLQVDWALGNQNGISWDGPDMGLFISWLQGRRADYITTDGFLTTNSQPHNSTGTYNPPSLVIRPTAVFVNASAAYRMTTTPTIPAGKARYWVNATTPDDTNTTVYQDQVVVVKFPRAYEMTKKTVSGPITTTGWTAVTIDPGLGAGTSDIDMVVERSRNGTARAMVEGPQGKFHVTDDSLKNYTAVVAADTNITFSANQSTDPIGNIKDANFTWQFTNGTLPSQPRYNITTTFNYSTAVINTRASHSFVVNLTVVEAGGNRTYRDFKIYVDDTPPVARIKTNRTGTGSVNGSTLWVDEDIPIKFDGTLSSDIAYAGAPGSLNLLDLIPDSEGNRGYRWDYEDDHIVDSNLRVITKAYDKPGFYNVTLQVMDWVGHTSTVNATLHLIVNDTTKPTPNWVILDPGNNWAVTTSLTEDKPYAFNASSSSDNLDDSANLSYAWHFPGPAACTPLCPQGNISSARGSAGWNVTVTWSEFNVSYNVTLNVTDRGFRDPAQPQKPNWGNRTSGVAVSVDVKTHPDLKYVAASLKITPGDPEENQQINVSFMIENDKNRANATAVTVTLTAKDPTGTVVLVSTTPLWFDETWNSLPSQRVDTGKRVRFTFLLSFPSQGNKSLEIRFHDAVEPYTWVDGSNRITGSLFVKLAGWVIPAVFIGVIAGVILVAYGLRTLSRYRSGELVFRKKEKKEKKEKKKLDEDEETEEPEEEAEPETKEKRRL